MRLTAGPRRRPCLTEFAITLAAFLVALQRIDAAEGPGPGRHNFYRGGPLTTYADETIRSIDALGGEIRATRSSGSGTTPWRPRASATPSGSTAMSPRGIFSSAAAGWQR